MHGIWTISTFSMKYTRSQNYTNMMVGKYGIPTFEVVFVVFVVVV